MPSISLIYLGKMLPTPATVCYQEGKHPGHLLILHCIMQFNTQFCRQINVTALQAKPLLSLILLPFGRNTGQERLVIDEQHLLAKTRHTEHLTRVGICPTDHDRATATLLLLDHQRV